jgi:hypothetical protein
MPRCPIESADEVRARRRDAVATFRGCAKGKPGFANIDAARAADFLYDDSGPRSDAKPG